MLAMERPERAEDKSMGEDVCLREEFSPTIAEHAKQCLALFDECMAMPGIRADRSWINGVGLAWARVYEWACLRVFVSPNRSIDHRLRFSPEAVEAVHGAMDDICDALLSCE
jgi:hypothetical protein